MFNAYITVYDPDGKAMTKARLAKVIEREAPALGTHAYPATHLGIGCLRIEERWTDDYRVAYRATTGVLRTIGYRFSAAQNSAAWRARA